MKKLNVAETGLLRELFIKRMTEDGKGHCAIFSIREDGSTFQNYYGTDMQMVLHCFDAAVQDYLDRYSGNGRKVFEGRSQKDLVGGMAGEARAPARKVDTPMREAPDYA